MLHRIGRYWRTIKYLKPIQIRYQIYNRVKKSFPVSKDYKFFEVGHTADIDPAVWIPSTTFYSDGAFTFLNKSKSFGNSINWEYSNFGALWTYNLTYFNYLQQSDISKKTGIALIHDFIRNCPADGRGYNPYPTSLRIINWIKFCLKFGVNDLFIKKSTYNQLLFLKDNLEYHLMGNHLLENGFSLLIGGIYFEELKFLHKGCDIVEKELKEQILEDGGHFERSPMYHQILLERLLDSYNLIVHSSALDENFEDFLKSKGQKMLGWLQASTFRNGSIPRVNDSVQGVAPDTYQLIEYGKRLGLQVPDIKLGESGYRMIRGNKYEWFIDVGKVGPDYIPGHAHSDTLSFILHVMEKPILVDTGISTYEESERRVTERSTAAHNTVIVNNEDQTEVWKAFRVGRRAEIVELDEGKNYINAEHNGFKHIGIRHARYFEWFENNLFINDTIDGDKIERSVANFHFHPEIEVKKQGEKITADSLCISFSEHSKLNLNTYQYADGYNRLRHATVLEIEFTKKLQTKIKVV